MNKKLTIFLILSFLSLQTFSFFHQAEFGFEEHEHDEDVCEIYLYCEQSKDNISNAVISLQELKYFIFAIFNWISPLTTLFVAFVSYKIKKIV